MITEIASTAKNIVELGTGQGAGGAGIMLVLRENATFTTINYADGHVFGEQLEPWAGDKRLTRLYADTLAPDVLSRVADGIDLLIIDTTHEAWHAAAELRLWQDKLADGAAVVVDDLNQHDMMAFWDSIPYEKRIVGYQGVFRYDASIRYAVRFKRPDETTYGGGSKEGKE